jgi:hypothetical protein
LPGSQGRTLAAAQSEWIGRRTQSGLAPPPRKRTCSAQPRRPVLVGERGGMDDRSGCGATASPGGGGHWLRSHPVGRLVTAAGIRGPRTAACVSASQPLVRRRAGINDSASGSLVQVDALSRRLGRLSLHLRGGQDCGRLRVQIARR